MLSPDRRVVAVLGPTNTGKTHLAVERMLGHRSGMIGLPLRLLAREIYDRMARIKGTRAVALVTGEEKIVPPQAAYWVATVEAMPLDRPVAFLAVDEIQFAGDPERGHVFTDRLLRARGTEETMFLGAETIRPLIRRLVPEALVETRPRMSTLRFAGTRKLSRLKPRSAIVAFSVDSVYAIAELMRRQRGGTALVMGALSPRTRNAQVALFQSGEVDYLVATDAIGMGLNMDVDHVAFAETVKFDGRAPRRLTAAEVAQIGGRAGRHMNDGTFGLTAEAEPFDPDTVERVEQHRFETLRGLYWRNPDLDFGSLDALIASLARGPQTQGLLRAREAEDEASLRLLSNERAVRDVATNRARLQLLWDVCRIPDFRKSAVEHHARLLGRIYAHLTGVDEVIPADWVAGHLAQLDRVEGDIDTLLARIAHVRTWTYVTHRTEWLVDAAHWQERSRAIEDRLSDALHERLTQRFVDRRTALLARRLQDKRELDCLVERDGTVLVESEIVGRLEGLRFVADRSAQAASDLGRRALKAAASRGLRIEIAARLRALLSGSDRDLELDHDGRIVWRGTTIARLIRGPHALEPRIDIPANELVNAEAAGALKQRLEAWLERHLRHRLAALYMIVDAPLAGDAKGVAYRMQDELGALPRPEIAFEAKEALGAFGLRFGRTTAYVPALLKPERRALLGLLYAVRHGHAAPLPLPSPSAVWWNVNPELPVGYYRALGFWIIGAKALRVDVLERVAKAASTALRDGALLPSADLARIAACPAEELGGVLAAIGYRARGKGDGLRYVPARKRRDRPESARRPDTPFSALAHLLRRP